MTLGGGGGEGGHLPYKKKKIGDAPSLAWGCKEFCSHVDCSGQNTTATNIFRCPSIL